MKRISGQNIEFEELAKLVLSWITCAKRPLTVTELQHALAVVPGDLELYLENLPQIKDMVSVCAGLVTIDQKSKVIRLVHYTTQEYFRRTQGRWFPKSETMVAKICITYLSFTSFESGFCRNRAKFKKRMQLHPLYDYSAKN